MVQKIHDQVISTPPGALRRVVEKVLQTPIQAIHSIRAKPIGGSVGLGTMGIFLVDGEAQTSSQEVSWSSVVKVMDLSVALNPSKGNPHREIDVIRSGVFSRVIGGIRAAHYYDIQERNGLHFVWQEDLTTAPQAPWVAEYFTETAANLGRFNTHWSEEALPTWLWLDRSGSKAKYLSPAYDKAFDQLPDLQRNPLVQKAIPATLLPHLLQMWDAGDAIFTTIQNAPKGVCHLGCHPRNLFPMRTAAGESLTVAIDWASVGIDSLGVDPGSMLAAAVKWLELPVHTAAELVEPVCEAYIQGAREIGWRGNEDLVRLTYLACTGVGEAARIINVIRSAASTPGVVNQIEMLMAASCEEVFAQWQDVLTLFLENHNKALRLHKDIAGQRSFTTN